MAHDPSSTPAHVDDRGASAPVEHGEHDPDVPYREVAPPPALRPLLACLWQRRADGGATGLVVPDGCVDLMLITDAGSSSLVVAGPDTGPHHSTLGPDGAIAGIRFAPGTARGALGVPLHALRDERPLLDDLWDRPTVEALAEAAAGAARPELVLAAAVAERAREAAQPDAAVGDVVRRLSATDRPPSVRRMAAELGLSERQLHRRCTAELGYGPKTLHRVLRFQAALARARRGDDLSTVAHECGYADQPHMARDVADLAGVPLTTLLAAS